MREELGEGRWGRGVSAEEEGFPADLRTCVEADKVILIRIMHARTLPEGLPGAPAYAYFSLLSPFVTEGQQSLVNEDAPSRGPVSQSTPAERGQRFPHFFLPSNVELLASALLMWHGHILQTPDAQRVVHGTGSLALPQAFSNRLHLTESDLLQTSGSWQHLRIITNLGSFSQVLMPGATPPTSEARTLVPWSQQQF